MPLNFDAAAVPLNSGAEVHEEQLKESHFESFHVEASQVEAPQVVPESPQFASLRESLTASEDDPRPRASIYRRRSYWVMLLLFVLMVGGIVALALLKPLTDTLGIFDPVACVMLVYVWGIFTLQFWMMEWPHMDVQVWLMILITGGAFVAPTFAVPNYWVSWNDHLYWRIGLWVLDLAICVLVYFRSVSGPHYSLAPGSLAGKTFVITGCNTGIGYVTAQAFLFAGAKVVFACRSESKARDAMQSIVTNSKGKIKPEQQVFIALDLSNKASIRAFADEYKRQGLDLHVLALNAGVILQQRGVCGDGLDMTLISNHLGHFLLVQLLLPILLGMESKGEVPRILQVNSCLAYEHTAFDFSELKHVEGEIEKERFLQKPYEMFRAYGQTKLCNMLTMQELATRLANRGSKIPVNAIHPGEIMTDIFRDFHWIIVTLSEVFRPIALLLLKSPEQGSRGTIYACTTPNMATADEMSGRFLMRLSPIKDNVAWQDKKACRRAWDLSRELMGAPDVPDV